MTAGETSLGRRLSGGTVAWLVTGARLVLGTVWIVAGLLKAGDLAGSVRAVRAYRLLPDATAQIVGSALPFAEVALGVLLVIGLGVRVSGIFSALLLVAFTVGISSAAARGLRIDCGCFGRGGELGAAERPAYGLEILRDVGLLLLAGLCSLAPRSRLALDAVVTTSLIETGSG